MTISTATSLRVLFVGPLWHGSDALGMANAIRRNGHATQAVDPAGVLPKLREGFLFRAVRRLLTPAFVATANARVLAEARILRPELVVVFKGAMVRPLLIEELKALGAYVVNFYPDVSFRTHDPLIPKCLPLYDWVFTTKSYGLIDMKEQLGITSAEFLPHGFDPDCHRPLAVSNESMARMGADAAFIGTWSPKKEQFLTRLAEGAPEIRLRIWGSQWERCGPGPLTSRIEGRSILGDLYPLAINCSTINLCILSEARVGASSGDRTTARTFQIPACDAFMLHERTDELGRFFTEGEEVGCFGDPDELVEKTLYYLDHADERERIRAAGHRRCLAEDSLAHRAERIIAQYVESTAGKHDHA